MIEGFTPPLPVKSKDPGGIKVRYKYQNTTGQYSSGRYRRCDVEVG